MKKVKIIISAILILCLTVCFAGCSSNHDKGSLKDNLIDGWNNWMQSFSQPMVLIGENSTGNLELVVQDAED